MTGSKPSAITAEKRAKLIEAFREGGTQRIACGVARVAPRTLQTWMKRGLDDLNEWGEACAACEEDGMAPEEWPPPSFYAGFYLDVAEALGTRDLDWLRNLKQTSSKEAGQWQRFAWLLERTNPAEFALKDRAVNDPNADGAQGKIEDRSASLADLARVLEAAGALVQIGRGSDRSEVPAGRALLPASRNS